MEKLTPCLVQACKIIFAKFTVCKIMLETVYLRKAKQFPVIPENILTRLFQILSFNIYYFRRNYTK